MSGDDLIATLERTTAAAMASGKPLAARLKMIADEVRSKSPPFADAVDAFVGRLVNAEAGGEAPNVGDAFPDFVLADQRGRFVSLAELRASGPVIVAFLRGHWCPYCRITAGALSEIAERARGLGARIVAVTPESRAFAEALDRDTNGAFPIVSDLDNGYALSLNLAIWVDSEMSALIDGAGWNVARYQGNDAWLLPIPAIFALSPDGRVLFRHVNPDYRQRADIEEMLARLGASV
jgi:peroxiredoxin